MDAFVRIENIGNYAAFAACGRRRRKRQKPFSYNWKKGYLSPMDNKSIRDRIEDFKEWISEHAKVVMPAVLLICVSITVIVAVNVNRKAAEEVEAQLAEMPANAEEPIQGEGDTPEEIPQLELEENAYPAVNTLISNYYKAMAAGDVDAVVSMNEYVEEKEKLRIREMSKYTEDYPELTVYTKKGPVEGSYLAYVYSKMKFTEYDQLVPGMQAFYVCTDENGECYINGGEDNSVVVQYIKDVSLQEDVVDLNNRVAVEYNELLASDEELGAYLFDLSKRIDVSVGEALAKAEAEEARQQEAAADGESGAEGSEAEGTGEEPAEEPAQSAESPQEQASEPAATIKKVKATDVVNIRSSDSETADRIGKAQVGDEFTLLEERGNGWSKITFEGKDAFIKSEFLAVVSEAPAADAAPEQAGNDSSTDSAPAAATQTASAGNGDTVTVKTSVNVRKSASESGEKLGLVYEGEKLELVVKQADGWTRVKYKGQTAFVKSDYVE